MAQQYTPNRSQSSTRPTPESDKNPDLTPKLTLELTPAPASETRRATEGAHPADHGRQYPVAEVMPPDQVHQPEPEPESEHEPRPGRRYQLTYFAPRERWKKKIRGRVVYFGHRCKKTDYDAYQFALAAYREYMAILELTLAAPWEAIGPVDMFGQLMPLSGQKGAVDYNFGEPGGEGSSLGPARRREPSLERCVAVHLDEMFQDVAIGDCSAGHFAQINTHLSHFMKHMGKEISIGEIKATGLKHYRSIVVDEVMDGQIKRPTANHRIKNACRLLRWAYRSEILHELPRILVTGNGKNELLIQEEAPVIRVFTIEEVQQMWQYATDKMRLSIALALNIGAYSVDIAHLDAKEVNWQEGAERICRKRTKTGSANKVPTVDYKLWPVTAKLLQRLATSKESGFVLLNANGKQLWTRMLTEDRRLRSTDNVRNDWMRLVDKLERVGLRQPNDPRSFKELRKTVATMLRSDPRYATCYSHFLGHAPSSVADQHYAAPPQVLLDEGIDWLGEQFDLKLTSQIKLPRKKRTSKTSGRKKRNTKR